MALRWATLAVLLYLTRHAACQQGIMNSQELKDAMYPKMSGGDACVRLLNATGTVGCLATGGRDAVGTLLRLDSLPTDEAVAALPDDTTFVLSPALLAPFLQQCLASQALLQRTRGVLIEAGPPAEYSQAAAAPQASFALYADQGYQWNPTGAGLLGQDLPFPVFQMDEAMTQQAQERAAYNDEQKDMKGALHVARMELNMQAQGNSSACLAAQTCLPLGGHSVLAALPPLRNASGPAGNLPLILVLATADSTSLFHQMATGAEAQISGLIAMLAAANILGSNPAAASYTRHLVFAALNGEAWGFMGSKRLLWEMQQGNASVAGLSLEAAEAVVEVSQVGRANSSSSGGQEAYSLYVHQDKRQGAASVARLLAALQNGTGATSAEVGGPVSVSPAGAATPGLPPSSAASLFRAAAAAQPPLQPVPAVVLADHDATFQGSSYHSSNDVLANVSTASITVAAVTLARALHTLASDPGEALAPLPVNYTEVQLLVSSLAQCLLNDTLGLQCPLAQALMTPTTGSTSTSHYVGILRTITADPQTPDPNVKSDYERFLWSYLAFATTLNYTLNATAGPGAVASGSSSMSGDASSSSSGGGQALRCQPYNTTACPEGWACAGYRNLPGEDGMGVCLNTTARFVAAYSTSLECSGCNGTATLADSRWQLTDGAAAWEQRGGWPRDAVWTESNWPISTPSLTFYLQEDPSTEWALFIAGCLVTLASLIAALGVQWQWQRRQRRR